VNVTCPDCRSVFRVDPAKVPLGGVRARCSVCGGVISVTAPDLVESLGRASVAATAEAADATTMVIPAVSAPAAPAQIAEDPRHESEAETAFESDDEAAPEPAFDEPVAEPAPSATHAAPQAPQAPLAPPAPHAAPPPATVTPVSRPSIPTMSPPMPGQDPGSTPRPFAAIGAATPPRPTTGPSMTPPRAPFSPPVRPTFAPPAAPAAATPAPPPFMPPSVPAPRTTQPRTMLPFPAPSVPGFRPAAVPAVPASPAAVAPEVPAVPTVPVTPAEGPPRRVINPFLNNDPNQKAKRLARALVSDMVAYLPQKREEGLKNGTLKTLFREEIKKSYEEYVDQIGKEFADTTTHFQDALNEILAGGTKMF
jgi:predicted Zn finger-like uncharacterized protein